MSVFLRSFVRPCCLVLVFFLVVDFSFSQVGSDDILPPSPTAASLGVMDMVPADLYTGSISPSIMLGTIESRSLSLDLQLRYSSSGFRPSEAAPWTGLGWNLNIGGVITRSARGLPDDRQGRGYFDNSNRIPSNPYLFTASYEDRLEYAAGLIDLEPDIFSYSCPGSSGRVIFSKNEGVLSPFLQPATNTRIRMLRHTSWIEGFVITTNDGICYYYGLSSDKNREAIEYTEFESISGTRPSIETYPSAWFLTEIISADKTDTISIYYSNDLMETCGFKTAKTISSLRSNDAQGSEACSQLTESESSSIITHYTSKADSICGAGGVVIFDRSAERVDITEANKLNKLIFKNMYGEELKRLEFYYDYFGGESAATDSRLRLDSLRISGGDISQPPYIFDYFSMQPVSYGSNSYDHWGYFNGLMNQDMKPAVYPDKNAPFSGAKRYPSSQSSASTVLKSITYPTGGISTFVWEGHDFGYEGDKRVQNSLYSRANAIVRADAENKPDGAYDEAEFYVPFSQSAGINIFMADRTGFLEGFVGDVYIKNSSGHVVAHYSSDVRPDTLYDNAGFPSELHYQVYGSLYLSGPATYKIEADVGMIDNYASGSISWNVPNDDPEVSGAKTSACGGLRIKRVTLSDGKGISPDIVTSYVYKCFDDTLRSSGVLASGTPRYYYPQFIPQFLGDPLIKGSKGEFPVYSGQCEYRVYTQNNLIYNHYTSGSHIGYRNIKLIHGRGGEFGWEEYTFTSPYEYKPQVNNVYPYPPSESYAWKHGLLLKKTVYDADKNMVEETEQGWDIPSGNEQNSRVAGGVKVCFLRNVGMEGLDSVAVEPYHFETGWLKLLWHESTVDGVSRRQNFGYDNGYMIQNSVSYVGSDGSVFKEKKTYPFDIESGVYPGMTAKNMISFPVEVRRLRDGMVVGSEISAWAQFGSLIKPQSVYQLKIDEPISSLRSFNGNPGSAYRKVSGIDRYDRYGNIVQYSRPGDIPTSYIWGYRGSYPVAEIKGGSYDEISAMLGGLEMHLADGSYDAASLFDYLDNNDIMLSVLSWDAGRGVSRMIDVSGLSNYYEYDDFGRLRASYDNERNLESMYLYNYSRDISGMGEEEISGLSLSKDYNYVVELRAREEGLDIDDIISAYTVSKATAGISYFDGFGRSIQSNMLKGSAWGEDLVSSVEYDAMGNVLRSTLPFVSQGGGAFVSDYYSALSSMEIYSGEMPWSEVVYEPKANPRKIELGSPGLLFQPGGGHSRTFTYGCNNPAISAIRYSAAAGSVVEFDYAPGSLYKSESKDEDGRRRVEYKDTEGKIILSRRAGDSEDLETYYVYDELGRLRIVVPPLAEGSVDSLDLIYRYSYDSWGRRIGAWLPGQDAELEIEYDELDRVVLRTDARGISTYTNYDKFSRVVESGLKAFSGSSGSTGDRVLQRLDYDRYRFSGAANGLDNIPVGASVNNKGRLLHKQNSLPGESGFSLDSYVFDDKGRVLLEASVSPAGVQRRYFDYDFVGNVLEDKDKYEGSSLLPGVMYEHAYTRSYLDNNQPDEVLCSFSSGGFADRSWLLEKNIYDVVGRLSDRSHHSNSQLVSYTYNIRNQIRAIDAGQAFNMNLYYEDGEGLKGLTEQFGGNISAMSWNSEQLGKGAYVFQYDDFNRLVEADWEGDGPDSLYSTSYKYDKGGNILELKRNMSADNGDVKRLNDFTYLYKGNQLTGLIRANEKKYMVWPGDIDNNGKVETGDLLDFGLIYSNSSEGVSVNKRVLRGRDSVSVNWEGKNVYSVEGDTMIYADSDGSGLIDLADTLAIHLNLGRSHVLSDGVDFVSTYEYDESGNMVYDSYKNMRIGYNYMNLPDTIVFEGRGKIVMRYWPGGSLYDRRVFDFNDSLLSATTYSGSYIFENDSLREIRNSAGYIRPESDGLRQYYVYSDHLGNTRLIKDEEGSTVSEYNYYPFGLINNNLSINKDYKFRYNGKEEIEDFGLGWMAYGARMYDAEIGRWHVVDPEGERHFDYTPYHYTFNNPINFIDPFGMDTLKVDPDGVYNGGGIDDADVYPKEVLKEKKKEGRKARRKEKRISYNSGFIIYGTGMNGESSKRINMGIVLARINGAEFLELMGLITTAIPAKLKFSRAGKPDRDKAAFKAINIGLGAGEGAHELSDESKASAVNKVGLDSVPVKFKSYPWYKGNHAFDKSGNKRGPYNDGDTIFYEYFMDGTKIDSIRFK